MQTMQQHDQQQQHEGAPASEAGLLEEIIQSTSQNVDAISPLMRAEIDIQIATAKRFPRSIRKFQQEAMSMACLNEETAASCLYALPRAGKSLEGPSVRLAEIIVGAWTNLRVGARIVEEGDNFLTAQGFCHDLERNIAATVEVRRRITYRNGKRFNDDMITVTGNAAASIAYRNAVFRVVPKAYWAPVFEQVRVTALGKAETLGARRTKAFDYAKKMGVTEDKILAALAKKSVEDVGLEDLLRLRSIFTAIKEGDVKLDDAFRPPQTDAPEMPPARTSLRGGNGTPAKEPVKDPEKAPEREPGVEADESPADAIERDDMIRRLQEQIDAAATTADIDQIEADLLMHKEFLGKDHHDVLAAACREKGLAMQKPRGRRDTKI